MQGASAVLAKLKELKEDCIAFIFSSSKGNKLQQMPDNFASMPSFIDEIRERLINDKRSIESLREAVNTLQGKRQLLCQPGNVTDNSFGFGERELASAGGQEKHKATIQKHISWFDSIQAPLKEIVSAANGEVSSSEMGGKYTLAQMREIIRKVPEAIAQLKRARASEAKSFSANIRSLRLEYEAQKRAREREIQQSLSESISAFNSLQEELIKAKEVIKKLQGERQRLEEQLRRSREAHDLVYEKGIPAPTVALEEVAGAERDSAAVKLQKAREEGVLVGQRQQREARDEEVERMQQLLSECKAKCREKDEEAKVLSCENEQLQLFKEKANSEIKNLLNALKDEQEKQKRLSEDLESLTSALSKHSRY